MKRRTVRHKHVKVTHAHHKPYRKRHYALLVASIALGLAVINAVAMYFNTEYISRQLASRSIADTVDVRDNTTSESKIASTYGFGITYNPNKYYASAIDATTGELYIGTELDASRAYNAVRLSRQATDTKNGESFKLIYYQNDKPTNQALNSIEKTYVFDKQPNQSQLVNINSTNVTYGGVSFLRSEWNRKLSNGSVNLSVKITTYTAVVNGSPLTVVSSGGLSASTSPSDVIMQTFTTAARTQASIQSPERVALKYSQSLTLIDRLLGVQVASAALPNYTAAERISATYSPAVVKVYNVMVGDFALDGQVVLRDQLTGGTGSGFIVSSDGYIATNGHVAVIDARDQIITYALMAAASGNTVPLEALINMSRLTDADLAGAKTTEEQAKIIVKKLYDIPASRFSFVNEKQNLLVGLGEKQVDIKELVEKTQNRQSYSGGATIKIATLKQADYDGIILPTVTGEFTKSDVALIKIDGSNYPMVRLGDITSISQGASLNIIGFPGIGSSNGIVSETKTAATLTTGKVSSKKEDTGGHNLIETDTEIGHGNSGGPAFDDNGDVVGIATYAIDPGGQGDGTLNYVRDVADFKEIAEKSSVNYERSVTQKYWEEGIEQFYTARYKKAVASFAKAKELYPNHPKATELTAIAEKRIANGENIDDFPVVLVVVLSLVVVAGVGVSVFLIYRHKNAHNALVQGVVAGQLQPQVPGAPAQVIPAAVPPAQLFGQPVAPAPNPAPNPLNSPPQAPIVQAPQFTQPTASVESQPSSNFPPQPPTGNTPT